MAASASSYTFNRRPATNEEHANLARGGNNDPARSFFGSVWYDALERDLRLPFDPETNPKIKYCVWRFEMKSKDDKTMQRPHAHFMVTFYEPVRLTQARKILNHPYPNWMEVCRDTEKSEAYIRKENGGAISEAFTGGYKPQKGMVGGQAEMLQAALNGVPEHELMVQFPAAYSRHHAAVSKVCAVAAIPRALPDMPYVEIHWGVTGSGKSHLLNTRYPDAYKKVGAGKWFDGIKSHDKIIFEEFDPASEKDSIRLPRMLEILDKYQCRVEVKGGTAQLQAKEFYFSSNINPTEWWVGYPMEQQKAFFRRVDKIYYYYQKYDGQLHRVETPWSDPDAPRIRPGLKGSPTRPHAAKAGDSKPLAPEDALPVVLAEPSFAGAGYSSPKKKHFKDLVSPPTPWAAGEEKALNDVLDRLEAEDREKQLTLEQMFDLGGPMVEMGSLGHTKCPHGLFLTEACYYCQLDKELDM